MGQLLHFIGSRPLVGYYLEFDVAMINRACGPCWAWACYSRRSRSSLYYDDQVQQLPPHQQFVQRRDRPAVAT